MANEEKNLEIQKEMSNEEIKNLIYTIRGKQVMLDSDVARLFEYTTKDLNRNVKNNIERFPEYYCFQLTNEEYKSLRCKNFTLNENGRGQHRKYLLYVFTEYGITMLAGLLKSEVAVNVSIRNEKYKGDLLQGKTFTVDPITHRRLENMGEEQKYLIEKNHEAIIDDETWNKVQEILKKRSESYNKGTRNGSFRRMYSFSGITYCAFCGRLVTRKNWVSSGKDKKAWYCSTAIKQGRKYCRDSKPIPETVIEKCFIDAYRVLCADKATIIRNFLEKAEPILKENSNKEEIEKLNMQEHDLKEKLKIFENDEDLFRSKKQLDYIKVKVIAEQDKNISFNIAS